MHKTVEMSIQILDYYCINTAFTFIYIISYCKNKEFIFGKWTKSFAKMENDNCDYSVGVSFSSPQILEIFLSCHFSSFSPSKIGYNDSRLQLISTGQIHFLPKRIFVEGIEVLKLESVFLMHISY